MRQATSAKSHSRSTRTTEHSAIRRREHQHLFLLHGARIWRAGAAAGRQVRPAGIAQACAECLQQPGPTVGGGTAPEADDDLARLRAGEATSLVLLSATAMGLATCPMTDPLEIPETRAAVRDDVFGTSGHPQMLMRVGWTAVDADPLPSTPRRPLPEVANWLLDGAFVGDDAASRTG